MLQICCVWFFVYAATMMTTTAAALYLVNCLCVCECKRCIFFEETVTHKRTRNKPPHINIPSKYESDMEREKQSKEKREKNTHKFTHTRKIRPIIRVSSFRHMPIDFVPVLEWTKFLIYVIVHLVEWHNMQLDPLHSNVTWVMLTMSSSVTLF